jgi:hypothetical protein
MTTKTVKPETPAQAPVFELRQGQKQANLDIINYVAQHQPCGFLQLRGQFGQNSEKSFKVRLNHLVISLQLQADKSGWSMESWTFALGEMAGKLGRDLSAQAEAKPQAKPQPKAEAQPPEHDGHDETYEPPEVYVGTVAPPRQPEVMTAPDFKPKPMQALRPGAQDFMRCPSRGARC